MCSERPQGNNADEWHIFLYEHLANYPGEDNGRTFMAVQIAEAIDAAFQAGVEAGRKEIRREEQCDVCGGDCSSAAAPQYNCPKQKSPREGV